MIIHVGVPWVPWPRRLATTATSGQWQDSRLVGHIACILYEHPFSSEIKLVFSRCAALPWQYNSTTLSLSCPRSKRFPETSSSVLVSDTRIVRRDRPTGYLGEGTSSCLVKSSCSTTSNRSQPETARFIRGGETIVEGKKLQGIWKF